ncbi:oligopeptidase A [Coraliomargarita sinensis]|uniref:oligopeptidase A n=1 Tax=Coraliomargarita sinensis TaxID=2174842 RepID=A0A317ZN71_9BACT|nr:M3 family metallopeptidase [Coraliomargarita sinensis]PXA05637.1 oligopeptidase A [Coraliomargarita sinensis]
MHPFLSEDFYINWPALTPDHIEADINKALQDARSTVDTVAGQEAPLSYANTIAALDDGLEPLNRAWGLVSHLDSVCNSPELRAAHNKMLPKVTEFFSGIPLNDALWEKIKAFGESDDVAKLTPTKQRYVEETLADFREQGADLPGEKKKRAAELQNRLAELTQKYSENCLDATNAWEKIIHEESGLSGLPESAISAAKQDAEQKGHHDAWRFTLQAPSYIAVMTYADSEALREEIWRAFDEIGRGKSYNNQELVREILDLRQELAQLMGEKDFADHVTKRRMAGSGSKALQFTEDLFNKVSDQFQKEAEQIRQYKSDTKGEEKELLQPWEAAYWAEKQRKAHYDFDEETLRPYFPINKVIDGMFDIVQEIFDLRIEERDTRSGMWNMGSELQDTPGGDKEHTSRMPEPASPEAVATWHKEVKFYELFDARTDEMLGAFYADWHPRESKRGGAWMNYLITGNRDPEAGDRTPHLGLICGNLTPSVGDKPALLTHSEVETIFHEFGHLLHHLCGEVEVKSLNGVNVPWDFVELPSQIMENWCWERQSLDRFARHHETGEPIPDALFDKMLAARNYMKASFNVRQLSFGKMDLELHMNWPNTSKEDLDTFIEDALEGYAAEYKTKPKPKAYNMGHLFSHPVGYAAGYYSYKWAEVLDADAFTRFKEEGILNPKTGREFRDKILAKGNSKDPTELYKDFMGREPDPNALLRRDGIMYD